MSTLAMYPEIALLNGKLVVNACSSCLSPTFTELMLIKLTQIHREDAYCHHFVISFMKPSVLDAQILHVIWLEMICISKISLGYSLYKPWFLFKFWTLFLSSAAGMISAISWGFPSKVPKKRCMNDGRFRAAGHENMVDHTGEISSPIRTSSMHIFFLSSNKNDSSVYQWSILNAVWYII